MNNYKDVIKKHHTEVVDEMPINNPIGQFKLALLRKNIQSTDSVLDVGAGNGIVTKEVVKMALFVCAIDFTPKMFELLLQIDGITSYYGDLTEINFPDNFDVIYSFGTLYYIQELDLAIKNIHLALKKNGRAILEFENALSPLKWWVDRQYNLPQKRVYPWQLRKLLMGFKIKKVHYYKMFPSFMGGLSQSLFFGKIPFVKYLCLSIIVEVEKC